MRIKWPSCFGLVVGVCVFELDMLDASELAPIHSIPIYLYGAERRSGLLIPELFEAGFVASTYRC